MLIITHFRYHQFLIHNIFGALLILYIQLVFSVFSYVKTTSYGSTALADIVPAVSVSITVNLNCCI